MNRPFLVPHAVQGKASDCRERGRDIGTTEGAEAVLLRGAEPLAGFDDVESRALAGPGKLARAFGLSTKHTNLDLVRSMLTIRDAPAVPPSRVVRSARIGLNDHATTTKPWRLYVRGSSGVSRR